MKWSTLEHADLKVRALGCTLLYFRRRGKIAEIVDDPQFYVSFVRRLFKRMRLVREEEMMWAEDEKVLARSSLQLLVEHAS